MFGRAHDGLESVWVDVGGWPVHARVSTGEPAVLEPALVLVHGLGGSSRYMSPLADRLGTLWRVLAPDLPGFGLTPGPRAALDVPALSEALAGWMEAAGVTRGVLLGNSLGCQVVVDLAVRRPDKVAALVLAGPTADPLHRSAPDQALRWALNAAREPWSSWSPLIRDYRDAGIRRLLGTLRGLLDDRIEAKLPQVRAPALVVRGARDPIVPQRWAEEAVRLLPDARLVVIPGAPHALNSNAMSDLGRETTGFLLERAAEVGVRWASAARPSSAGPCPPTTERRSDDRAA
jgi:pimeloyl-ACP methyl ester carboxylesterase